LDKFQPGDNQDFRYGLRRERSEASQQQSIAEYRDRLKHAEEWADVLDPEGNDYNRGQR
jgi:hypothetical protein